MNTTAILACLLVGVSSSMACNLTAVLACTDTYTSLITTRATSMTLDLLCTSTKDYTRCVEDACGGNFPQEYKDMINSIFQTYGLECDVNKGDAGRLVCPHMLLLLAPTLVIASLFR